MEIIRTIVKSATKEPSKYDMWLQNGALQYYAADGWKPVSASVDASLYYTKTELNEVLNDQFTAFNLELQELLGTDYQAKLSGPGYVKTNAAGVVSYDNSEFATTTLVTEQITSVKGDITTINNSITNIDSGKADADSVYSKTETYTKTEVNNLISTIPTFTITVVDSLPATGEDKVLYVVPNSSGSGSDMYTEYIWVNNKFEFIGTSSGTIDLTDYYTKTQADDRYALKTSIPTVPTRVSELTNDSGYVTSSTTSLSNYYTKSQSNSNYLSTSTSNLTYYYTKTQSDNRYATTSTSSLTNYYTKTQSDDKYATTSSVTSLTTTVGNKVNNHNGVTAIAQFSTNSAALSHSTSNTSQLVISTE